MAGPRLGHRVEEGECEPARPRDSHCETCEFCGATFPGRAGLRAHMAHKDSPCRRKGRLQGGKVRKRLRDREEDDSGISMEEEERPQPPTPPALRIKINLSKKRVLSIDSSEDSEPTTPKPTNNMPAMVSIKQELLSEIEVKAEPGLTTSRAPSLATSRSSSLAPGIRVSLERMDGSTYSVALSSSVPQVNTTQRKPKISIKSGSELAMKDSSMPRTRPKEIENMPGDRHTMEKSTTEKSDKKRGRPSKEDIKSLLKETIFGETMEGSGKEEYEPTIKKSQFKKVDTFALAKSTRKSETPDMLSTSPRSQQIKLTEHTIKSKSKDISKIKSTSLMTNEVPSTAFTDKAQKKVRRSPSFTAWQTSTSKVDPQTTDLGNRMKHPPVKPKHRQASNAKASTRCHLCPAIGPHLCTFPPPKAEAGGRSVVEGGLAPRLPHRLVGAWVAFNYSFLHSHRAVFCYRVTPGHKVDILCRTNGQARLRFIIKFSRPGKVGTEAAVDGPADKILLAGRGAVDLFRAKLIRYTISVLS